MRSTGMFSSWQNQEMPDFTRGIYDARALAMTRLSQQARALDAHGVVGVTIERSHREIERDRGGGTKYTDLSSRCTSSAPPSSRSSAVRRRRPSPSTCSSTTRSERDRRARAVRPRPRPPDIPEHGIERLVRMRDRSFFTSDLSVNEFLLVKAAGFEPLGLVVGTSIYHIGFQQSAHGSRTRRWTS